MRNIKLEIEYDGTNYCGWQIQNRRASCVVRCAQESIQGTIEKTLQKILREKVKLIASGRTDSGVHAECQVANFRTNTKIPAQNLQKALNSNLPNDIAIISAQDAALDFHARYGAKYKTYRYNILNRQYHSALMRQQAYFYPYKLNVTLMRKEAKVLIGKHDFRSFATTGEKERSSVRIIKDIKIIKKGDLLYIYITANGFLYNMVRCIVGTLLDIGRGKIKQGGLKKILRAKQRAKSGPNAPAQGLTLVRVSY